MRRILYGDVVALACFIRTVDKQERRALLEKLIDEAHCADKIRKRFLSLCAGSGDGSLIGVCYGLPKDTLGCFGDRDFAEAMLQVFTAILAWRSDQAARGGRTVPSA